MLALVCLCI